MEKTLDLNKPVQTRDGRKARIICTDRKSVMYQVVALVESSDGSEEGACSYTKTGQYHAGYQDQSDLVNVPEKRTVYLNMYEDGREIRIHKTREAADKSAAESREACVKVPYTVGQFDD
jgi:hypothetical protein